MSSKEFLRERNEKLEDENRRLALRIRELEDEVLRLRTLSHPHRSEMTDVVGQLTYTPMPAFGPVFVRDQPHLE